MSTLYSVTEKPAKKELIGTSLYDKNYENYMNDK